MYKNFCKILIGKKIRLISEWSFAKYLYEKFNIGFSKPQTDVCDYCFEMTFLGGNKMSECQKLQFQQHLSDCDKYKNLKTAILSSDLSTKLVIEFYYGQNKALPKLNNTSSFYSRSLWFFLFNIYVHNNKESNMIYFLEGEFKKGANSVSSIVFGIPKQTHLKQYNEIVF